jgi:type IV secretion system protein VirD4
MNSQGEHVIQLAVLIAVAALLLCLRPTWRRSGTAYGTAKWATMQHCQQKGMLADSDGLILGQTRDGRLLRMLRYIHLALFGPAGGGKTVSFAVPWLLTKRGASMVVHDPKGELYRLTAARRRAMGHQVVRLDPFEVCGPGADAFNPLDLIESRANCEDDARALSEAMVLRTGEEKDPHFNDQAANVITGLLSFILSDLRPDQRNLSSLREMVTDADLCGPTVAAMRAKGGVFARMAGVISQLEDKEKASVFSTVHRHTTFLDSDAINTCTGSSSFDARQLLKGKMTIYLILPPHQLEAQSRWLRLVIASLIRLIGHEGTQENKR